LFVGINRLDIDDYIVLDCLIMIYD